MNLLFYRYGSICEPDMIEGFLELGCSVFEITAEITEKNIPAGQRVQLLYQTISNGSYDFVFSVNFYPFISEVCKICGLYYLCQTVDAPVFELFSHSVENKCNRIFLFDAAQYREVAPRNPGCVFHLPLATNPARWERVIAEAAPDSVRKFQSDLSFVGSLYTEKCPYDQLEGASDYLTGYLDGVMNAQRTIYGCYFLEDVLTDAVVEEFCTHTKDFYLPPEASVRNDRAVMARMYLCAKITSAERMRTMSLLGTRFSVDLYTGSDTKTLPVQNRGRAKTLTEMPLIFRHSKINLNMTSKAIREGIPLRIFDILGCGGFLLTNYQSELPSLFVLGRDFDVYGSEDELLEKTEFYLTHERDRMEIASCGLKTVKEYHNYPRRLSEMLSLAFSPHASAQV